MIKDHVLIANQIKLNQYFHVYIEMPKMEFGRMVNNAMTVIMTQEMVVMIIKLLIIIAAITY